MGWGLAVLRLHARFGKRGIGARGVVYVRAGRRRRTEDLDRSERIGGVWGRRSALGRQALTAVFRLRERGDDCAALFETGLSGQDFIQLALEGVPLEQLPARSFIEARLSFGQTVLISRLHFHLSREDGANDVVVENDIERYRGGPGEKDERERRNRADLRAS